MNYQEFITKKSVSNAPPTGSITAGHISDHLFDYQVRIVEWALDRGRAAIFADTGLGKTAIFLEWARHIKGQVLILAPLAVGTQIVSEAERFGVDVTQTRDGTYGSRITVTNYENVEKYDLADVQAVVLDESSILKAYSSKYRKYLTEACAHIPFRLCTTATPAPNDLVELTNHAVFLGVNSFNEIRALYFITADSTVHKWRLKRHAVKDFWKFVSDWAMALRMPSDLGYSDEKHILPPVVYHEHMITTDFKAPGDLFALEAVGLKDQREAKRATLHERCQEAADHINATDDQWVIWCNLNDESALLTEMINGAAEVKGAHPNTLKEERMISFAGGSIQRLVTKPSICGFGMNWQHCHKVAFVGLSHSFEQMYQAIRRCWRFGQEHQVDVHMFIADVEGSIRSNIDKKEKEHTRMISEMVENFSAEQDKTKGGPAADPHKDTGTGWEMYRGDCIQEIDKIESESVGLSVFSPPFPAMYAYTDMQQDMGNSTSMDELVEHYEHLIQPDKLMRVLKPGRNVCVHCSQPTATITKDGYIGRMDFRGRIIQSMIDAGWVYWTEVTIDKNPQYKAQRSKDRGLLFKTLATDSSMMQPAHADYLLVFRKPGDNPEPIRAGISEKYNPSGEGWITSEEWIEWASPVWYRHFKGSPYKGITESDVLNVKAARDANDERHLCPLQLGVIERCVKLWSNPGDIVFSPFGGIGSEGYESLLWNRRYIGIELKESYYQEALRNLRYAETVIGSKSGELFPETGFKAS